MPFGSFTYTKGNDKPLHFFLISLLSYNYYNLQPRHTNLVHQALIDW